MKIFKKIDREKKYQIMINLIDKTSFFKIFGIWIILIFIFAILYHFISSSSVGVLANSQGNQVTGFFDYIYYSFITATSTGYGDIVPQGIGMRLLAISNVIIGMLMMAVVTSKLVSMKQEKLLEQIYHLSFSEKVNRILTGLSLFKIESEKITNNLLENEVVDRKTLFSIKMNFSSLKNNMVDIKGELVDKKGFMKKLEHSHIDQITSGLSYVFDEILEIINLLEKNEVSFKNPIILEEIYYITNLGTQILYKIKSDFPIFTGKVDDIIKQVNKTKKSIMQFRIIDTNQDIEIKISPDLPS